ncbi:hypothetical protein PTSG_12341 [Salpingoeca rosetta]|uniref:HIT domain-containing protein n=1 Tax=Salpingoeca rosetta (strain ATCC 50818 / BSB-021) TaxID=946362 RepID=F2UBR5_SALR5|nr:uncharacterized protein PTSG_12341 [Salpingoeca rosetta]EGD73931.1 hypothetical protein PTSG_12341 [Salpingoeca rosetta]|eukprot:XP_004993494.1 hypothetical protein PTSG_12341 [Salpingoeca rosetta]
MSRFVVALRPCGQLRERLTEPLELSAGVHILGRSPQTKVKQQLCSRRQIELDVDTARGTVTLKQQLGPNACSVNGQTISRGNSVAVSRGARISMLADSPDETTFTLDIHEYAPCGMTTPESTPLTQFDTSASSTASSVRPDATSFDTKPSAHAPAITINLTSNTGAATITITNNITAADDADSSRLTTPGGDAVTEEDTGQPKQRSDKQQRRVTSECVDHWANALTELVRHPERHADDIVYETVDTLVINDKYPKARYHFLVLPKRVITDLTCLTRHDRHLIQRLQETAMTFGKMIQEDKPGVKFHTGFHAVPSMNQVHLHLISQDFDSVSLKNKKHWNSFNTPYFVPARKVYEMLKNEGRIHFDEAKYKEYLKKPLVCHRCRQEMRNMPTLKRHLKEHLTNP